MQENMDFGHFPNNKYCFTTFKILPWFVSVPFPFHCQTSLFETVTGSTLWASCHSNSAGLSWDQSWSYRHQTGPRQWLTCLSDGIGFLPGPLTLPLTASHIFQAWMGSLPWWWECSQTTEPQRESAYWAPDYITYADGLLAKAGHRPVPGSHLSVHPWQSNKQDTGFISETQRKTFYKGHTQHTH